MATSQTVVMVTSVWSASCPRPLTPTWLGALLRSPFSLSLIMNTPNFIHKGLVWRGKLWMFLSRGARIPVCLTEAKIQPVVAISHVCQWGLGSVWEESFSTGSVTKRLPKPHSDIDKWVMWQGSHDGKSHGQILDCQLLLVVWFETFGGQSCWGNLQVPDEVLLSPQLYMVPCGCIPPSPNTRYTDIKTYIPSYTVQVIYW